MDKIDTIEKAVEVVNKGSFGTMFQVLMLLIILGVLYKQFKDAGVIKKLKDKIDEIKND